jgi:hypothetical protein
VFRPEGGEEKRESLDSKLILLLVAIVMVLVLETSGASVLGREG